MAVLWLNGHVPEITKLSDERIARLLDRITPCKTVDGVLHAISPLMTEDKKPVTLWNTAFMWSPMLLEPVSGPLYDLAFIETYHTCGYIALFKPSLGEVISQIPENLLADVTHFEVEMGDTVGCYSQGDGHRTMTRLYTTYSQEDRIKREGAAAADVLPLLGRADAMVSALEALRRQAQVQTPESNAQSRRLKLI